jgi:hypothetical protein
LPDLALAKVFRSTAAAVQNARRPSRAAAPRQLRQFSFSSDGQQQRQQHDMQRRKRCWQQHVLLAMSCVFLISTLGALAQVTTAAVAAGHVLPFQMLACTQKYLVLTTMQHK